MNKCIILACLLIVSIQSSFANYTLNIAETKRVDAAIVSINHYINKNGEIYRGILIKRLGKILDRDISEKNIAIVTKIQSGISKHHAYTHSFHAENTEDENSIQEVNPSIHQINTNDFSFIFSSESNRCKENPCNTTEDFIKIRGNVLNPAIKFIEVNDYRLKSYQGSDWEYNANIAYGNFKNGENIYNIHYLSAGGDIVFTEKFSIHKTDPTPVTAPVQNIFQGEVISQTLDTTTSSTTPSSAIPGVDINEVRTYWIGLINEERKTLGLPSYTYSSSLDSTANLWSQIALSRGYIDHKVSTTDSYYDYSKKAAWMRDNGVVCKNISRITFSESIGWQKYSCPSGADCTPAFKKSIKRTFDFYMSEKGKSNAPHYKAIKNNLFTTMGLGLSAQHLGNGSYQMFLTNHYCTTNIQ